MTPTSSQQTYTDLLIQYQPKTIKTEQEYKRALTVVEGMMSGDLTEAETALFELLVLLIEKYEESHPNKDEFVSFLGSGFLRMLFGKFFIGSLFGC